MALAGTGANYSAPWWVAWLHDVPRVNLRFRSVPGHFEPRNDGYIQSFLFILGVAAVSLALNLLLLFVHYTRLCCCQRGENGNVKRSSVCCSTWCVVLATLLCSTAIGIGFYGNSETNGGLKKVTTNIVDANSTMHSINTLVEKTGNNLKGKVASPLEKLQDSYSRFPEFQQVVQRGFVKAEGLRQLLQALPFWTANGQLAYIAETLASIEFYRWLVYLVLLIVNTLICLLVLLGLSKQSRCLLLIALLAGVLMLIVCWASLGLNVVLVVGMSDFCIAPENYISNLTLEYGIMGNDVLNYYIHCSIVSRSPFQKRLTGGLRLLSDVQSIILELIVFTAEDIPNTQAQLLNIQQSLNSTEVSLHQLTALVNCRGLHKDYIGAMHGLCWEGTVGMLFLTLFSLASTILLNIVICVTPKTWCYFYRRNSHYEDVEEDEICRTACGNTRRPPLPSFYSYSSFGSQTSIQPTSQSITNAPVSEYMRAVSIPSHT
uniref:protein tweety homolog 2 isoform X2 n=1 Tax=Myxine glutinosa TaxID=7769 RepID=UPI00358FC020